MKFGGASVATPSHFSKIADIIISKRASFPRIVIVISAMANQTDQLINLAKEVHPDPPRREYDMLITVGERISIALLAMALAKKGAQAESFTGSQSGILTCKKHSDARIIDVKPGRLLQALTQDKIVIVAGCQGVSHEGQITTLGRNGSDTTAVALGAAFDAEQVEFYKDVEGIYDSDPKKNSLAKVFETLTYDEALNIVKKGAKILHPRCIELAKQNQLKLNIVSFQSKIIGTKIHDLSIPKLNIPQYESEEVLIP